MTALIHELTNMASDPSVATTDLLRRALVAAKRLDSHELVSWINSELNGYREGEVPDYRQIRGQLVAEHPYRKPIPFMPDPEIMELISMLDIRQSIPELTKLAESSTGLYCHFPPEPERMLVGMIEATCGLTLRPALKFSPVQILGVIENVRTCILDWALDLEGRGVVGEGMTFTQQEKQIVNEQHYHFGDVSGSQIQIGSNGSTQSQQNSTSHDVEVLRSLIVALDLAIANSKVGGEVADELRAEIATLRAQATSPKPKWEIIKSTARSFKTIAEGAMGNVLGELAKPHLTALLALAAA